MGHLNVCIGIYFVPNFIKMIDKGIRFCRQQKMVCFDTLYGFYGKYLKDGFSGRYKGPFKLKRQFFARIKRQIILTGFNICAQTKHRYGSDCNECNPKSGIQTGEATPRRFPLHQTYLV